MVIFICCLLYSRLYGDKNIEIYSIINKSINLRISACRRGIGLGITYSVCTFIPHKAHRNPNVGVRRTVVVGISVVVDITAVSRVTRVNSTQPPVAGQFPNSNKYQHLTRNIEITEET